MNQHQSLYLEIYFICVCVGKLIFPPRNITLTFYAELATLRSRPTKCSTVALKSAGAQKCGLCWRYSTFLTLHRRPLGQRAEQCSYDYCGDNIPSVCKTINNLKMAVPENHLRDRPPTSLLTDSVQPLSKTRWVLDSIL